MESLLSSLTVYMMIGIIVVVAISQFHRLIGSILGIIFWVAVAMLGSTAYDKGGGIKLINIEFSRSGFFLFCGAFIAFNAYNLYQAIKRRSAYTNRRSSDEQ